MPVVRTDHGLSLKKINELVYLTIYLIWVIYVLIGIRLEIKYAASHLSYKYVCMYIHLCLHSSLCLYNQL